MLHATLIHGQSAPKHFWRFGGVATCGCLLGNVGRRPKSSSIHRMSCYRNWVCGKLGDVDQKDAPPSPLLRAVFLKYSHSDVKTVLGFAQ